MMKRTILAAAALACITLTTPQRATAQVSIDIQQPGFGLHAGPPVYGPPVVVPPPAVVYEPRAYYAPRPPKHYWKHWDKHHWKHWHHGHGHGHHGDWD
jgi:hypothetical protein